MIALLMVLRSTFAALDPAAVAIKGTAHLWVKYFQRSPATPVDFALLPTPYSQFLHRLLQFTFLTLRKWREDTYDRALQESGVRLAHAKLVKLLPSFSTLNPSHLQNLLQFLREGMRSSFERAGVSVPDNPFGARGADQ